MLIKYFNEKIDLSDFSYEINSNQLRCDEFDKNNHPEIAYAGCSFTFGASLPYLENWSGALFKSLGVDRKYVSLGYNGGSIEYICNAVTKYAENFEQTSTFFILFPDFNRKNVFYQKKEYVCINIKNHKSFDFLWESKEEQVNHQIFHIKKMLGFLKSKNKKVFWSTWGEEESVILSKYDLDGFVYMDSLMVENNSVPINDTNKKYYFKARDNNHPGIRYNSGVAKIFEKSYYDL